MSVPQTQSPRKVTKQNIWTRIHPNILMKTEVVQIANWTAKYHVFRRITQSLFNCIRHCTCGCHLILICKNCEKKKNTFCTFASTPIMASRTSSIDLYSIYSDMLTYQVSTTFLIITCYICNVFPCASRIAGAWCYGHPM